MKSLHIGLFLSLLLLLAACRNETPAQLTASSTAVRFDLNSSSTLTLHNRGSNEPIHWHVSAEPLWLRLSDDGGTIAPGESVTLQLVVNRSLTEVAPDTYDDVLRLTATTGTRADIRPAGTVNVALSMRVSDFAAANACPPPTVTGLRLEEATPAPMLLETFGDFVPGQLLVRFEDDELRTLGSFSLSSAALEVAADYGLSLLSSAGGYGPDLFRVSGDPEVLAARLEADPRVRYAEPNRYLETQSVPNDARLNTQWHLCTFGLPQAWALETGNPSVVVAILDSGVDIDHEDLRDRVLPGYDFCGVRTGSCPADANGWDDDPRPGSDTNRHGTHVAGIVAATGDNGIGVAGVAYNARILPVKIFNDAGGGATFAALGAGMRWAMGLPVEDVPNNPNPARILNLSLGASGTSATLDEFVALATGQGALVVTASGNDGSAAGLRTPANAPGSLAVGSVNSNYQRSSFSNFDVRPDGNTVHLLAPGGFSIEAFGCPNRKVPSTYPDNRYGCEAGTSMSAPYVAGVAALVWSQNPSFSAEQVRQRLIASSYREPNWDALEYGAGIVCADRALGAATTCGR